MSGPRYMRFYSSGVATATPGTQTAFGPTAHAMADAVDRLLLAVTGGLGAACVHAAATRGADGIGSMWIGVGVAGSSLAVSALATLAAPTLGEISAEMARAFNARPAADDDPPASAPLTDLPEREIVRLVPYHAHGLERMDTSGTVAPDFTPPDAVPALLKLPDGRTIEKSKILDMIIGAQVNGLSREEWMRRGWKKSEWQTARDLFAINGLATPRNQPGGKLLVTSRQARGALQL